MDSEGMGQVAGYISEADMIALDRAWSSLSAGADWCEHQMDDEDGSSSLHCASGASIQAAEHLRAGRTAEAVASLQSCTRNIDEVGFYSLKHFYDVDEIQQVRTLANRIVSEQE